MSTTGSPARAVAEAVGLTLAALLVSLLVGVVFLVPLFVLGYDVQSTGVLLASTAAGQLGFLAVGYGYVRRRGVPVRLAAPSRRDALVAAGGVVAAVALAVALSALLSALDLVPGSVVGDVGARDPVFFLGLAALSVVLVAPAEELLFRGAVQGRLRQHVGPVPAVLGSSLLFGSMHLANYTGALAPIVAGALLIAAIGAVLGALYEYTGNLAVPIATHATYNAVLLVVAYVTA
ncbi:CPBP family intramembrane metalloprotease (plasmid) [Halarchaeum sp. CBA1220]|uniref:CPBP family intramembrane glutamic endopeptidase n=1 Tax=Halarchaeum sp. CBA1220 TaxID=1853682 RepID=UPI000F3A84D6|nr:CPBP family intramembrane glutamic endopeptidase [Halarchaeum sp. CBA1220]QLC35028.1 CPBP family intramembrane metalloprotease [Halarchaeum sp. CBA1220]